MSLGLSDSTDIDLSCDPTPDPVAFLTFDPNIKWDLNRDIEETDLKLEEESTNAGEEDEMWRCRFDSATTRLRIALFASRRARSISRKAEECDESKEIRER